VTVRIGVLGAAKIGPAAVLGPALDLEGVEVVAIASRDRERAQAQAEAHGVRRVLDDYEAVLADPEVDVVYNPLPVSLHHPWTIRALEAGKHVLCEKPFACNADEAAEMVEAAHRTGQHLVEAFHWRYHPLAPRLAEVVAEIGPLRHLAAGFSVPIDPSDAVRHSRALGGGALMDLGCYPVQWVRFIAGAEPEVDWARSVEGEAGVDVSMRAGLRFPGDVTAEIETSMAMGTEIGAWLRVEGDDGSVLVTNPLAPHLGHVLEVVLGDASRRETVGGMTTYHHQLAALRDLVVDGRPVPTGGADAIATMQAIDGIYLTAGLARRGD
jgi:predicted dehydrogenase